MIPLVILGVPIVDTVFSFVRRVAAGRSFYEADKDHLHHRLVRLGHGPRRGVMILWAWTALLSGVALLPTYTNRGNAMVPFGLAAARRSCSTSCSTPASAARGRPCGPGHPAGALTGRRPRGAATEAVEPVAVVDLAPPTQAGVEPGRPAPSDRGSPDLTGPAVRNRLRIVSQAPSSPRGRRGIEQGFRW